MLHPSLRTTLLSGCALASAAALALQAPPPAMAKDGQNAAIIAGVAIGAAALAAASRSHQSEYYQPYYSGEPYPPPQPQPMYVPPPNYGYRYSAVFHPYPGVTCYPAQRSCYKANGNYSPTISHRIYGY